MKPILPVLLLNLNDRFEDERFIKNWKEACEKLAEELTKNYLFKDNTLEIITQKLNSLHKITCGKGFKDEEPRF